MEEEGANVSKDWSVDAGSSAGAARTTAVGVIRTGYATLLRVLSRWAANPHKLFRPENPSVGRFEDALDSLRRCPTVASGSKHVDRTRIDKVTGTDRGAYKLYRNFGFRQALQLKMRSAAVNASMGTVLFGVYDAAREHRFLDEASCALSRTAIAATLAGSIHGMFCAPLEVCALRIRQAYDGRAEVSNSRTWRASMLTWSLGCSWLRALAAIVPLGIVRDSFGVCAFFVVFETLQANSTRMWTIHVQNIHRTGERDSGQAHSQSLSLASLGRIGCTLFSGGCAGMAYRVASWPVDALLARRVQVCEAGTKHLQVATIAHSAKALFKEVGYRRALFPPASLLAKTFPTSALGLLVYEWLR